MTSTDLTTLPEPWERQPGEGMKAFHHFAGYRDLGVQRSLEKAGRAAGKSPDYMEELSARFNWVERAEAYDMLLERRRREAQESEVEAMSRRHVGAALYAQDIAITRMRGRGTEGEPGYVYPLNPNTLDAADTARLLDLGVKMERMARGMPTELIKGAFSIHPSELQTWMRDIVELSLDFVPDERRDAYMMAIYQFVEGRQAR